MVKWRLGMCVGREWPSLLALGVHQISNTIDNALSKGAHEGSDTLKIFRLSACLTHLSSFRKCCFRHRADIKAQKLACFGLYTQ